MLDLDQVKKILKNYNQEHLLHFWDELNDSQKEKLLYQLSNIDFQRISDLYNLLKTVKIPEGEIIEPLDYFIEKDLSEAKRNDLENLGKQLLKNGNYAVVTMAGGQGTRLGHKGPKGTFELNLSPRKMSLFEVLSEKIKQANKTYNIQIPWYIMTSETNNDETIEFFKKKNYFGLPENKVKFFVQDKLPLVDINGKILLSEIYQVHEASNGNGNIFKAMSKNNIIYDMKKNSIKWVFISGIDNILVKIADPIFLALTVTNNTEIGAKTIFKQDPYSKDWVFCKKDSKPAMLGYERITEEITNAKFENKFLYREINILCHLFSLNALEKIASIDLPYHKAIKKNTFINEEGMKIVPDSLNSYKFETFIFDSFRFFDNITLLRVEEFKEFAPIKDPVGVYSPDTATKLYMKEEFQNK